MNTNSIRCILTRDSKTREKLIDVFALDEFKDYVRRNGLDEGIYICNDQPSRQPGNHWFMIYHSNSSVTFVDSFAMDPSFYGVEGELSMYSTIERLPFQIQSNSSDVCGEFIIYFCLWLARYKSLYSIISGFSRVDLDANSEKVFKFVHGIFNSHR